jgi:hypothetical protein
MTALRAWPDDVPPPGAPDTVDDEIEALAALYREQQRVRGIDPPPPPPPPAWKPVGALAERLWTALPADGRGVEYTRLIRTVAADASDQRDVQMLVFGLVLDGRAYVMPGDYGCSLVGRGSDPRCGVHAYRTSL